VCLNNLTTTLETQMAMTAKQRADEAAYQARQDMHMLAEAAAIQAEKSRHAAAKQAAADSIKKLQTVVSKPTKSAPRPAPTARVGPKK
jgi:hypothetical protein